MARAARLSGADPEDEDYEEFEEMLEQAEGTQVRVAHTHAQPSICTYTLKCKTLISSAAAFRLMIYFKKNTY